MSDPAALEEAARVEALWSTGLLPDADDEAFDTLTRLVASALGAPVALVNLLDTDTLWTVASHGDATGSVERSSSFCTHLVDGSAPLLTVEDATTDPRFAENIYVTAPGGIRSYAGAVISSPGGHRLGALCVVDTERRSFDDRALDVLRQAADQVEELIAARVARDAAAAAAGERSRYLATAQHQLKTPLAVITGWASALERWEDLDDRDRSDGIAAIGRAARQVRRQLDDILDEARAQLLGDRLRLRPVDLAAMVRGTGPATCDPDRLADLQIDAPTSVPVWAEAEAVHHIIAHILDNAGKYSPPDTPIELTARVDGDVAVLRIRDHGSGIAPGLDAFAPFERGEHAGQTTRGTGLGLHIVKTLAAQMHATVELVDAGPGTAVEVRFPLA